MHLRSLTLPLAAGIMAASTPALAQDSAGDRVNMVIVYGDDDVQPTANADEIVVVARLPESERYRIPETLRFSDDPSNTAWAQRVESFQFIGDFGTFSCSPTGAGGSTGCTQELIDAAYGERRESSEVRFGQLIAEARAARLATIDEDAAIRQAEVEAIEREYLERLEAERAAPVGDEVVDGSPPPLIDTEGRAIPSAPEREGPFDDGAGEPLPVDASAPAQIGGDN
ncbi:hypothetical protein MTsPCn7_07130 [Altererythrobacter sp. MTPC7]